MSGYRDRIQRFRELIKDGQTAVLLTNEKNIGYFSSFFHSEGYMLVTQELSCLLVDFRYSEAAQKKAECDRVVCFGSLFESLTALLSENKISTLLLEPDNITVERFNTFKKRLAQSGVEVKADIELARGISQIRIIKDETELQKIQTAQSIAEKAYLDMLNILKPGIKERDLAAFLEYKMKLYGAEDISFSLITITGKKTSLPHGVPSDEEVKSGDFFTCDFGAVYEGYHSDTTRTVAVGSATGEMRRIYNIVLRAQLKALEKVREGSKCCEVDKTARDIIAAEGYSEYFGHSTGHGVGLDIHEHPFVSAKSETVLKKGMVITDEPGIYLPGKFGVRIEDMLCVTDDGCRNFVSLPKELVII